MKGQFTLHLQMPTNADNRQITVLHFSDVPWHNKSWFNMLKSPKTRDNQRQQRPKGVTHRSDKTRQSVWCHLLVQCYLALRKWNSKWRDNLINEYVVNTGWDLHIKTKKCIHFSHFALKEEKHQHFYKVPIGTVSTSSLCQSLLRLRVMPAEQPAARQQSNDQNIRGSWACCDQVWNRHVHLSHFLWRNSPAATATGRWAEYTRW